MAKTDNTNNNVEAEAQTVETQPEVETVKAPLGIHIIRDDTGEVVASGYETTADAEAFVTGQLEPQGIAATVVAA